jgi:hypothetical protein
MPEADFWKLIVAIITGLLGGTVFAWAREYFSTRAHVIATQHDIKDIQKQLQDNAVITSYYSERAKHLATQDDLKEIQKQLGENTEITKTIEQKFFRSDFLSRSELAFREKQLAELYGPAYGVLRSQRRIYELWRAEQMNQVNYEIKQLFKRQNEFIRQLIINKAHLIEGAVMPKGFTDYATSTLVFDLYAAPTDEGRIPDHLATLDDVKFAMNFYDHIVVTTESLKARIEALYEQNAIIPEKLITRAVSGEREPARQQLQG